MRLTKIFSIYLISVIQFFVPVFAGNNVEQSRDNAYNSAPEIIKTLEDYPDDDKSCMEKVNLQPATQEETDELATCTLAEIVKMGYPLCNQECLDQLTEDELNKFFDMRAQQMKYILEKELERRVAQQLKRR